MFVRSILALLVLSVAAGGQTSAPKAATPSSQRKSTPKIAAAQHPTAVFHTTAGDMKCELFPDKAPHTVANFIGLATGRKAWTNPTTGKKVIGRPLYDGVIFHRTIPEFMIQGGDPKGNGEGGPGYQFDDELLPDLLFDRPGRLAMANSGLNTNGSQFFITEVVRPSLNPCFEENGCPRGGFTMHKNGGYTIFGQCDDASVELVKKIARMPCTAGAECNRDNYKPVNPVKILHIEIQTPGKTVTKKTSPAPKSSTPK